MSKRIGIDTAHWQSVVPWKDVAAAGVQFAWIKAVHGLSTKPDPQFERSWEGSRGVLPYGRGGYEWLTDADPVKQAENLIRVLERTGDLGELLPTVDVEEPTTQFRGEPLVLHALRCLRRVRELTGGVVLYTGAWYVTQYVANDSEIDRVVSRELLDEICSYPLFHAEYPRIELRDRRACATSNLAIPPARIGRIWRDRGIVEAVHQFDGDGGCLLPNGIDADFDAATLEGLERCTRVVVPAREHIADLSLTSPATRLLDERPEAEHTVKTEEIDL